MNIYTHAYNIHLGDFFKILRRIQVMQTTVKNIVGYSINTQTTKVFDQIQSEIFFTEDIMTICKRVPRKLSWQFEESLGGLI